MMVVLVCWALLFCIALAQCEELVIVNSGTAATRSIVAPAVRVYARYGLRLIHWIDWEAKEQNIFAWYAEFGWLTHGGIYAHVLDRAVFSCGVGYIDGWAAMGGRRFSLSSYHPRAIRGALTALCHELGHSVYGLRHTRAGCMSYHNSGQLKLSRRSKKQLITRLSGE